jgi:hypothetical protein
MMKFDKRTNSRRGKKGRENGWGIPLYEAVNEL